MEKKLISVIVPVYNQEKYLERCVNSILKQTYSNLEVILIDDGSTDKSSILCDNYMKLDSRIKVIHTENNGLSCARNTGLEIAKGDYIAFVDGDDWIEPEMYEIMINACLQNNVKLACCGRYDVDNLNNKKLGKCPYKTRKLDSNEMLSLMFVGRECDSIVCDKLYDSSIWNEIRFPERKYYEDIAVMYKIVSLLDFVIVVQDAFYNYFHHGRGITSSTNLKYALDYCDHTEIMLKDVSDKNPSIKEDALLVRINSITFFLRAYETQSKEIKHKFFKKTFKYKKELRSYFNVWSKSKCVSGKQKMLYILLVFNLYGIYRRLKMIVAKNYVKMKSF